MKSRAGLVKSVKFEKDQTVKAKLQLKLKVRMATMKMEPVVALAWAAMKAEASVAMIHAAEAAYEECLCRPP